jgi:hypothetical protein
MEAMKGKFSGAGKEISESVMVGLGDVESKCDCIHLE